MKNQNKQSGSTHLILIVVLVIALVGALGYIFWQNIAKKSTDSTQPTVTSTTMSPSPKPIEKLTFADWNVGFPQPADDTFTANRPKANQTLGDVDTYFIYSKKTDAVCPAFSDGSKATVGQVNRTLANNQITPPGSSKAMSASDFYSQYNAPAKVIGNYVYYYTPPQNDCGSDAPTATQQAAVKELKDQFPRLAS